MGIRGDPNSCYAHSLPFPSADGKEHALTVFSNASGMSCIQVDGDGSSRLGMPYKLSTPVTFYLRANEIVDSVFVIARRSNVPLFCQTPYLLVGPLVLCPLSPRSHPRLQS